MNLTSLLSALTRPVYTLLGMPMSAGDLLGFATGVLCVWLTVRANIWNFPAGIASSAILGLVFVEQRLFADAALQLVFIALSIRGMHQWYSAQHARESSPVYRAQAAELCWLGVAGVVLTLALWQGLEWLKGSAPVLDALITTLSLCAQWLLNRRALESWFFWIATDVISIPLYFSRGLPLIAALYVIFLLLCVQGFLRWRKQVALAPSGAAA